MQAPGNMPGQFSAYAENKKNFFAIGGTFPKILRQ